jgi:hypothetical protein
MNTRIPNPSWGYGFVETMISTLDRFLLDDIMLQKGVFDAIVMDHEALVKNLRSMPHVTITGKMIEEEDQRMRLIPFHAKYLSFELYKQKINPYKCRWSNR